MFISFVDYYLCGCDDFFLSFLFSGDAISIAGISIMFSLYMVSIFRSFPSLKQSELLLLKPFSITFEVAVCDSTCFMDFARIPY